MAGQGKKLPVVDARAGAAGSRPGGWAAFTDGGTVPAWVTAARVILVLALCATIPTVLGIDEGNRLVWTVCIALLPFFWMTFGYHLWRRICPLAVMAQLGRLVGRPGSRKMGDWMGKNYVLVQLGLLGVALSLRLVATNGSDVWLAGFLGVVVLAAITTSFVFGGKTWCNFVCPVGLVEKIYTEPARGSAAPETTSQCAPCVACKKHCPDIELVLARLRQEHRIIAHAGETLHKLLNEILGGAVIPRAETEVAAATYLVYYGNHIAKEDDVILSRAGQTLTPEDWEAVRNAVPPSHDPLFGDRPEARYQELRRQIARETLPGE